MKIFDITIEFSSLVSISKEVEESNSDYSFEIYCGAFKSKTKKIEKKSLLYSISNRKIEYYCNMKRKEKLKRKFIHLQLIFKVLLNFDYFQIPNKRFL